MIKMKKIKFTAYTKRGATKFFTLETSGVVRFEKNENPPLNEVIKYIQTITAADFSRGDFSFTPDQIMVKLGA